MSSTVGQVINCKAAVLWNEGTDLSIEDITVDPPKSGEVRIRMVAAGICRSDAHFIWGHQTDLPLNLENPIILGHEGSGIVESVGDGVTSVEVGDHVIPLWMPNCGKCPLCVSNPATNFCMAGNYFTIFYMDDGTSRVRVNGKPVQILGGCGTFAEYQVLRESSLAKVNPEPNLENAAIIGCAIGTGYGTAVNIAKVHPGSTCAIWGIGAIGLAVALGCKHSGARKIIAINRNEDKFEMAAKFGCNQFINTTKLEKPIEEILQAEGGVDYLFDCVCSKDVIESATKSLAPWGTYSAVGLGPKGTKLEVSVANLLSGQKYTGGYFGNYKPREGVQQLVQKYSENKLPIDAMITHRFRLEHINDAFNLLKAGKTIRSIIKF